MLLNIFEKMKKRAEQANKRLTREEIKESVAKSDFVKMLKDDKNKIFDILNKKEK